MLAYSTFRHSHHYHVNKCAGWTCLVSLTIHHIPGKLNVLAIALFHCPDLAAVVGLVESSLLT